MPAIHVRSEKESILRGRMQVIACLMSECQAPHLQKEERASRNRCRDHRELDKPVLLDVFDNALETGRAICSSREVAPERRISQKRCNAIKEPTMGWFTGEEEVILAFQRDELGARYFSRKFLSHRKRHAGIISAMHHERRHFDLG